MATILLTNRQTAQSLHGQSVLITLDSSQSNTYLFQFSIGNSVQSDESGNLGTISFIDTKGHSFKVTPVQPDFRFEGANYGLLNDGEAVIVTY
jgi:multidrug efflux pump subunit AcrA (membrane-fusion protein)